MVVKRASVNYITLAAVLASVPAFGTTKGLNQIVTPDVQPVGVLSVSYQQQDPNIANPSEVQLELGITKRFEAAVFTGFKPHEFIANAEYSIVAKGPYLLSGGFANWGSRGRQFPPNPYLIGGYYLAKDKFSLGATHVGSTYQGLFGYAHQVTPNLLAQIDWQTGLGNSLTGGFTYNITPQLSINPAVYYSNDAGHSIYGYAVLTWNIIAFK